VDQIFEMTMKKNSIKIPVLRKIKICQSPVVTLKSITLFWEVEIVSAKLFNHYQGQLFK
jgi:hypothetical protein